jgi:hypothetical protein
LGRLIFFILSVFKGPPWKSPACFRAAGNPYGTTHLPSLDWTVTTDRPIFD